jgi:alpha-tubulin suppressor-like RCC1 family protein
MSTNYNTCFIDSNGRDVSEEFVEKSYLLDVYANLIDPVKTPSLWLWGSNVDGELGNNTIVNTSSPIQTISGGTNWFQISSGSDHSVGIKSDGTLWLWGSGGAGRLGDNTVLSKSSPIQTISAGTNWRKVSAGSRNTGGIKTDGTLWMWGQGGFGQIGNGATSRSSPVQTISGGTNWKQISLSLSDDYTSAIKTDGTLWLWGVNSNGQLGDNYIQNPTANSPIQTVSGGSNWKQVSINGASAAIKTDGTLWLWGNGNNGRLGNNEVIARSSPVQTVSGGTNWKQVSMGQAHAAAIKTDGTLWVWGCNASGELGNNEVIARSSPVQTVSGGTNWKQVSMGQGYAAAIKTDGTLWLWGNGTNGKLGGDVVVNISSPVQTISGGTNWKQVSAGGGVTSSIREEGDW